MRIAHDAAAAGEDDNNGVLGSITSSDTGPYSPDPFSGRAREGKPVPALYRFGFRKVYVRGDAERCAGADGEALFPQRTVLRDRSLATEQKAIRGGAAAARGGLRPQNSTR